MKVQDQIVCLEKCFFFMQLVSSGDCVNGLVGGGVQVH